MCANDLKKRRNALYKNSKDINIYAPQLHPGIFSSMAETVSPLRLLHQDKNTCKVVPFSSGNKKLSHKEPFQIEKDLLYPLMRESDIQQWQSDAPYWIALPFTLDNRTTAMTPDECRVHYPLAFSFFEKTMDILHVGSLLENTLKEIFAAIKVVVKKRVGRIEAAVTGQKSKKPFIPWKANFFTPSQGENEAHFLCALLNSERVSQIIKKKLSSEAKNTALVDILKRIKFPRYSTDNPLHLEIASLSKHAHRMVELGIEVDELSQSLNGLTSKLLSH